jgi:anthranilate synthase component I
MKRIELRTSCKKMLADVHTPVGIYLRLRDRFRDTILMESTDHHAADNSYSFIGINAISGFEVKDFTSIEYKFPGQPPEKETITKPGQLTEKLGAYMQRFEVASVESKHAKAAQGLFGYTAYDAVQFFETVQLNSNSATAEIPLIRYRLYQYVIAIDHFKDEMHICENHIDGIESELQTVESLIRSKDVPVFPFKANADENVNILPDDFKAVVQKGIDHCLAGEVFQVVLSRRFSKRFTGDEFNVYRALRTVNPSPYLFYFDYGDYKLFGSSPETQVVILNGQAIVHPIAGTVKRTGDDEKDQQLAAALLNDPKENAEHVMLVDLARNDLSRLCDNVHVHYYKQVHYYSHVIHLVSEVRGTLKTGADPFRVMASTFPAGTLSGAPKYKAMQLIDNYEGTARNYYGGCIGFIGFDGSFNHAIMIRTFLSKQNTLHYQAGAGVVADSIPANELLEVDNKLKALKTAIELAETI